MLRVVRLFVLQGTSYSGKKTDARVSYVVDAIYAQRQQMRKGALGDGTAFTPEELVARERLASKGVEFPVADRLVREHGSDPILAAADSLAKQSAGAVKNLAGWQVRAVQRGYGAESPAAARRSPDSDLPEGPELPD